MRRLMGIAIALGAVWAGTIQGKEGVMPDLKGKKVLMVIAATDFRDEEYFEPYNRLRQCGAVVTVASSVKGAAVSVFGKTVTTDRQIAECKAGDYDAVVFIGGPGATEFFTNATAHVLARAAVDQGKVLAAICIAPVTLANAGVLKGKQATCFPSLQKQLTMQGTRVVKQDVVQDGKLLTATGPQVAREFAEALVKMLE
ncbi:MAG: DJ-1/PfpI family protein [Kiritimatiellae bacterium]|nr:DJ-1/PfpI family protein [Verrucomicrobiota bacterium]MBU4366207.1 DJ-1/PfpI family protein [Verrucomicrobiota bacterium]MCG2659794.1 DJ-1/PfpI family protein [Kiritimatiellia bacterium]